MNAFGTYERSNAQDESSEGLDTVDTELFVEKESSSGDFSEDIGSLVTHDESILFWWTWERLFSDEQVTILTDLFEKTFWAMLQKDFKDLLGVLSVVYTKETDSLTIWFVSWSLSLHCSLSRSELTKKKRRKWLKFLVESHGNWSTRFWWTCYLKRKKFYIWTNEYVENLKFQRRIDALYEELLLETTPEERILQIEQELDALQKWIEVVTDDTRYVKRKIAEREETKRYHTSIDQETPYVYKNTVRWMTQEEYKEWFIWIEPTRESLINKLYEHGQLFSVLLMFNDILSSSLWDELEKTDLSTIDFSSYTEELQKMILKELWTEDFWSEWDEEIKDLFISFFISFADTFLLFLDENKDTLFDEWSADQNDDKLMVLFREYSIPKLKEHKLVSYVLDEEIISYQERISNFDASREYDLKEENQLVWHEARIITKQEVKKVFESVLNNRLDWHKNKIVRNIAKKISKAIMDDDEIINTLMGMLHVDPLYGLSFSYSKRDIEKIMKAIELILEDKDIFSWSERLALRLVDIPDIDELFLKETKKNKKIISNISNSIRWILRDVRDELWKKKIRVNKPYFDMNKDYLRRIFVWEEKLLKN